MTASLQTFEHNGDRIAFREYPANGGGGKPGISYGATDDYGGAAVENKTHVHDLQATLLHLLGFDHEKLIYRFQGRDFRLTDIHGKVIQPILA